MNDIEETVGTMNDDDWDIDFSDIADEMTDTESTETETPEENQQTENGEGAEESTGTGETENGGEGQTFVLKYLGAEKSVNRDEVVTLAQKGMDYDRIRGRYDEAEKALAEANEKLNGYAAEAEWLEAMKDVAKEQGTDLGDIVMNIIASQQAAKNGTTVASELPKVKLDFERKSFEKEKADWEKSKGEKAPAIDADAEMKAEIDEFQNAFPEVAENAKAIPQEVWDAKNADPKKSLAQHYRNYLNKQKDAEIESLKSQLAAAQKSAENKQRSTGSQSSNGANQGDIWDRMWAEE